MIKNVDHLLVLFHDRKKKSQKALTALERIDDDTDKVIYLYIKQTVCIPNCVCTYVLFSHRTPRPRPISGPNFVQASTLREVLNTSMTPLPT